MAAKKAGRKTVKTTRKAPAPKAHWNSVEAYRKALQATEAALRRRPVRASELAVELGIRSQSVYDRVRALKELGVHVEEKLARVGNIGPATTLFHVTGKATVPAE
jgi:biotin operon repressor